jgi:hypothetical protein
MATVEALQAMDDRSRSPTPDYEEFHDIPEVPEVYEDIPVFSPEKSPEPDATEDAAECARPRSIEILRKSCSPISLPAKEVYDENFNVNREELDFNDPDGPECLHSRVSVKALRDKLNQMACGSPKCEGTPSKVTKTKETTREVRTHEKPTALSMSILSTTLDDRSQGTVAGNEFRSPPNRQLFEELDAQETAHASVDALEGLQDSEDGENRSFRMDDGREATPGQGNQQNSDLQAEGLQICDSPEPHATKESEDGESNAFSQYQDGSVDATPAQTLSRVVKVFSENLNDHDSQALTPNDHARATIAAMKAKCTARMPAPPPKVQESDEDIEVEYSNEEIEALADALLNPTKKKVPETPRTTTPSKINNHLREALKEIHYSPSARASAMLQKLRQKELFCKKVPAPKAPKGSILGLQPGRSLMPVDGLAAANMAALATVNASMSPHLKNNIQHSRRSKMPDKGHEAADRAAFSEVKSIRTRKLALFTQPELSTEEQEMQKQKWAEYVCKYGDKAKLRFEESCNDEHIPAPIFVQVDDSVDTNYGPVVMEGLQESIDGLQESIDGLQGSFSSEEKVGDGTMQLLKNDESVDALQQDDLSDDEICPEFAHRIQIDYAVQEKVDKIRQTQVFR